MLNSGNLYNSRKRRQIKINKVTWFLHPETTFMILITQLFHFLNTNMLRKLRKGHEN